MGGNGDMEMGTGNGDRLFSRGKGVVENGSEMVTGWLLGYLFSSVDD